MRRPKFRSLNSASNGSRRVDETPIRVKGRWTELYRAVDSRGQTIELPLAARRGAAAAKRFFRKVLGQPHTVNSRTITVDRNHVYPRAIAGMRADRELWPCSRLRQVKHINNTVEQDHRRVKRLVRPGPDFDGFRPARRMPTGDEVTATMSKEQIRMAGGRDMQAEAHFFAEPVQGDA